MLTTVYANVLCELACAPVAVIRVLPISSDTFADRFKLDMPELTVKAICGSLF